MRSRCTVVVLVSLLTAGVLLSAQSEEAPNVKPISQQGIIEALRIGGLTTQEMIAIVKERGVAFQVTEPVEADLRAAGAPPSLIEAVRANYRPPVSVPPTVQLGPLSKNEIATLLQVGAPSPRIEQIVNQRGVSFPLTPAIRTELSNAGAESALLTAIEAAWAKSGGALPAPPTETAAPPVTSRAPEAGAATPRQTTPRLRSIKEVHKLYVDKMKNNLDQYLRAELSKRLPGRFTLVLNKDEADAVMVGTGEQKTDAGSVFTGRYLGLHDTASGAVSIVDKAGTVLWASEAGDRTLLFGPLKRGGAPEVASRLVQDLKKSLDAEE
jgi:hypothetical protein